MALNKRICRSRW